MWMRGMVAAFMAALTMAGDAGAATLAGRVESAGAPLAGYRVTLYGTDAGKPGRCAKVLGSELSDGDGQWQITYTPPAAGSVLYVVAESAPKKKAPKPGQCPSLGKGAIALAAALGVGTTPSVVRVNERTTVATAYAFARFLDGPDLSGPAPGLPNAVQMFANLVDVATGDAGTVLTTSPNGNETSTQRTFNALSNMVAACVQASSACDTLFEKTKPPRGKRPGDTLQAMVNLAQAPWQNVAALLSLSLEPPATNQPALLARADIDAWTLALRFAGDGVSMNGPGNFAVDAQGTIWVANNYVYSPDPEAQVCASPLLLRFTPGGQYVAGSPYTGGGLSGVGFGVTLDPAGNVWAGNFGFAAPQCATPPPNNSVSKFAPDGTPLSPPEGFTNGGVSWPQGTVSDRGGSIWMANCGNDSVTRFPDGDATAAEQYTSALTGLARPFDIAFDRKGNAWVTGSASNNVAVLKPDGTPLKHSPIDDGLFDRPLGIAADSKGNMWVANSAALKVPCPDGALQPTGGSIVLLYKNQKPDRHAPFTGGGLTIPWGVAVDGDDNVWVANFSDQTLSYFCGARTSRCPPHVKTGDPIAPNGYGFDGFVRNTGVAIDPSGNVWVTNNWKPEGPFVPNPGGYQVVAFIGAAPPIKAPLIGPPQKP